MITISHLTKKYGQRLAVDDISFDVQQGEVLGFLGPNGAGKSTTMNIITGFIPYTDGKVEICGKDISDSPKEIKKKIGYLPEIPPLYMDMTVSDYLNFSAAIKKTDKAAAAKQINDITELLKITDVRGRLIKNLSKGYKQRVGFAQALIGMPEVLVLDEPTVGLDPNQIIEIRQLIKDLGKQHTIILSSHILPEVSAVCDRVVIINKGKVVATDKPENLSRVLAGSGRMLVTVSGPTEKVVPALRSIEGVKNVSISGRRSDTEISYTVESDSALDVRKPIFFAMAAGGCPIVEMRSQDKSLEEIFHELTTVATEEKKQ